MAPYGIASDKTPLRTAAMDCCCCCCCWCDGETPDARTLNGAGRRWWGCGSGVGGGVHSSSTAPPPPSDATWPTALMPMPLARGEEGSDAVRPETTTVGEQEGRRRIGTDGSRKMKAPTVSPPIPPSPSRISLPSLRKAGPMGICNEGESGGEGEAEAASVGDDAEE